MMDLHASSPRWMAVPEVLRGLFIMVRFTEMGSDRVQSQTDPRLARGLATSVYSREGLSDSTRPSIPDAEAVSPTTELERDRELLRDLAEGKYFVHCSESDILSRTILPGTLSNISRSTSSCICSSSGGSRHFPCLLGSGLRCPGVRFGCLGRPRPKGSSHCKRVSNSPDANILRMQP
jgi:hypothetical protein